MATRSLQRRHIDALVAIGESRSVHRAARDLGIAQPALSRLLGEAERLIGARLFERSSQGSRPTAQGETVLARARALQRGIERLGVALEQPATVRLGSIARAMHTLVPGLLEGLGAPSPYSVRLVEGSSTALLEAISAGQIDLAILKHTGASPKSHELRFEPLYDERVVIVCSAANAALPDAPIALSRLAAHEWVLPDRHTASRAAFDLFCSEHRLPAIRPIVESRSFETSLALVARTRFVSIVPESIARRHAAFGAIRIVKVRQPLPATPVTLVFHAALQGDPVLDAFRAQIHRAAAGARAELRSQRRKGKAERS